jgi:hypothetical protein
VNVRQNLPVYGILLSITTSFFIILFIRMDDNVLTVSVPPDLTVEEQNGLSDFFFLADDAAAKDDDDTGNDFGDLLLDDKVISGSGLTLLTNADAGVHCPLHCCLLCSWYWRWKFLCF